MHHPKTNIQADFDINPPTRYQLTAKRNYSHGRTDRRTDRRRVRQQRVVFPKKEKTTKKREKNTNKMYARGTRSFFPEQNAIQ